jgi:hypothetical protein
MYLINSRLALELLAAILKGMAAFFSSVILEKLSLAIIMV